MSLPPKRRPAGDTEATHPLSAQFDETPFSKTVSHVSHVSDVSRLRVMEELRSPRDLMKFPIPRPCHMCHRRQTCHGCV